MKVAGESVLWEYAVKDETSAHYQGVVDQFMSYLIGTVLCMPWDELTRSDEVFESAMLEFMDHLYRPGMVTERWDTPLGLSAVFRAQFIFLGVYVALR